MSTFPEMMREDKRSTFRPVASSRGPALFIVQPPDSEMDQAVFCGRIYALTWVKRAIARSLSG